MDSNNGMYQYRSIGKAIHIYFYEDIGFNQGGKPGVMGD